MNKSDLINEVAKVVPTTKEAKKSDGLHFLYHYKKSKKEEKGHIDRIRNF